jgi:hypothetical protein
MATLREFYDTDFPRILNAGGVLNVTEGADVLKVPARVHMDFDANARFLSCYLSSTVSPASVCIALLRGINEILTMSDGVEVSTGLPGEAPRGSGELKFTGRLFVYHEGEIEDNVLHELREIARKFEISLSRPQVCSGAHET